MDGGRKGLGLKRGSRGLGWLKPRVKGKPELGLSSAVPGGLGPKPKQRAGAWAQPSFDVMVSICSWDDGALV